MRVLSMPTKIRPKYRGALLFAGVMTSECGKVLLG